MRTKLIVFICLTLLTFSYLNSKHKLVTREDVHYFYARTFYPNIEFLKDTLDVGTIIQKGQKINGQFEYINSGRGGLVISEVIPACGCTAADFTKGELRSNEKGKITFQINTGEIDTGIFEKRLAVKTNGLIAQKVVMITGHYQPKTPVN